MGKKQSLETFAQELNEKAGLMAFEDNLIAPEWQAKKAKIEEEVDQLKDSRAKEITDYAINNREANPEEIKLKLREILRTYDEVISQIKRDLEVDITTVTDLPVSGLTSEEKITHTLKSTYGVDPQDKKSPRESFAGEKYLVSLFQDTVKFYQRYIEEYGNPIKLPKLFTNISNYEDVQKIILTGNGIVKPYRKIDILRACAIKRLAYVRNICIRHYADFFKSGAPEKLEAKIRYLIFNRKGPYGDDTSVFNQDGQAGDKKRDIKLETHNFRKKLIDELVIKMFQKAKAKPSDIMDVFGYKIATKTARGVFRLLQDLFYGELPVIGWQSIIHEDSETKGITQELDFHKLCRDEEQANKVFANLSVEKQESLHQSGERGVGSNEDSLVGYQAIHLVHWVPGSNGNRDYYPVELQILPASALISNQVVAPTSEYKQPRFDHFLKRAHGNNVLTKYEDQFPPLKGKTTTYDRFIREVQKKAK